MCVCDTCTTGRCASFLPFAVASLSQAAKSTGSWAPASFTCSLPSLWYCFSWLIGRCFTRPSPQPHANPTVVPHIPGIRHSRCSLPSHELARNDAPNADCHSAAMDVCLWYAPPHTLQPADKRLMLGATLLVCVPRLGWPRRCTRLAAGRRQASIGAAASLWAVQDRVWVRQAQRGALEGWS